MKSFRIPWKMIKEHDDNILTIDWYPSLRVAPSARILTDGTTHRLLVSENAKKPKIAKKKKNPWPPEIKGVLQNIPNHSVSFNLKKLVFVWEVTQKLYCIAFSLIF